MSLSVTLEQEEQAVIESMVASGRFASADAAVAYAVERLAHEDADRAARLAELNRSLDAAERTPIVGTAREVFDRIKARLREPA